MQVSSSHNRLVGLVSLIGFGLTMAIVSFLGWPGTGSFEAILNHADAGYTFSLFAKNLGFVLSFAGCFLLSYFFPRFVNKLLVSPWFVLTFSVVLIVSQLIEMHLKVLGLSQEVFYVASFFTGIGIAGNVSLWQYFICTQKSPLDAQVLLGGTALGALMYFAGLIFPPQTIQLVSVLGLAPLTALLLLWMKGVVEIISITNRVSIVRAQKSLKKGIVALLMPALCIAGLGFVAQCLRLCLNVFGVNDVLISMVLNAGLIEAALILLVYFGVTHYRFDMSLFARLVIPLLALGLFLVYAAGSYFTLALMSITYAAFVVGTIFCMISVNQVAKQFGFHPLALYALLFGMIYSGRFVAWLFVYGTWQLHIPIQNDILILYSCFFCVLVLFFLYGASALYERYQERYNISSWEFKTPEQQEDSTSNQLRKSALVSLYQLTSREAEVALFLVGGKSVAEIAKELFITENTVRYHMKHAYRKLNVHTRAEFMEFFKTLEINEER